MRAPLFAAALGLVLGSVLGPGVPAALAASEGGAITERHWSFDGMFGTYDRGAAQRGFQVYKQVCAACHSMELVHYRSLREIGFSEEQVSQIAASVEVQDGPNDAGEMFDRAGRPSDRFRSPFANKQAARAANNGALPPDLSLIVKARVGGANYVYSLLTGYHEPPAGVTMPDGMYYNTAFPGHQIAMAPPLSEGIVEYPEGVPATVEQMAADVTTFLAWASEPEMETRKRLGVKVVLFLFAFTGLLYAVKRKVWAAVAH